MSSLLDMPDTPVNRHLASKFGLDVVPMEKQLVDFVDTLLSFAKKRSSNSGWVEHEGDWEVVEFIFKGFESLYPQSAAHFRSEIDRLRGAQKNKYADAEDTNGRTFRHFLNMPEPFFRMFRVMFPRQNWDKQFTLRFIQRMPQFRVVEKL